MASVDSRVPQNPHGGCTHDRTWLQRMFSLVLVGAISLAACATARDGHSSAGHPWNATFKDLTGQTVSLRQYAGKVVVVHVFTTWDMACLRSVPELGRLMTDRKGRVQVVGVGMDLEGGLAMRAFVRALQPAYPVWLPSAAFSSGKTVFGLTQEVPRFFILAKDGTLRGGYSGYVPYDALVKMVDEARR